MNSIKNSKKILALSAAVGIGLLATTFVFADTDMVAPSVPTGLTATAVSTSQINLSWATSTDNVGVVGYVVSKNGVQIATTTATTYPSMGLTASTTYAYTVSAFDAAGNTSAQSPTVSATTLGVTTTPPPAPQSRMKPEEISINPNGHITIHGMTVTGVGTNSFTGTIWGIAYAVQYRETNFEFLFKDGHNGTSSTGQIQVGDEMGVMGVITHDAPMTIQAKAIRDYSLVKVRPVKHDNENGNDNEGSGRGNGNNENSNGNGHGNGSNGNGNGNGKNDQDIRNAIQQILNKINELQGRLNGNGNH